MCHSAVTRLSQRRRSMYIRLIREGVVKKTMVNKTLAALLYSAAALACIGLAQPAAAVSPPPGGGGTTGGGGTGSTGGTGGTGGGGFAGGANCPTPNPADGAQAFGQSTGPLGAWDGHPAIACTIFVDTTSYTQASGQSLPPLQTGYYWLSPYMHQVNIFINWANIVSCGEQWYGADIGKTGQSGEVYYPYPIAYLNIWGSTYNSSQGLVPQSAVPYLHALQSTYPWCTVQYIKN